MNTFTVPTLPVGHENWVVNPCDSAEQALEFIENLNAGVPYSIMMRTTQYKADDVVSELALDTLQHLVYEEQQVYCDVCGTHYHPEDPCIYH